MEQEQITDIAEEYYSREDIQKAIVYHSKNREAVPRYFEGFGKRPDTLQYENDVWNLAQKGATSFHYSEEIWKNPLDLDVGMTKEQLDNLRAGWDLIIDIDSKYLDYSKIATELIIKALNFHNVKNIGLKYSGNKGFHIGVAFDAFPKEVQGIKIKDFFPEGPRIIVSYLKEMISGKLKEQIAGLNPDKDLKNIKIIDEEGAKEVIPDLILVSSRHLLRMPYSLHEKTGLASIVIKPEQIKDFHVGWAKPERVIPKIFLPAPKKDEAKELILSALDWNAKQQMLKKELEEKMAAQKGKFRNDLVLTGILPEFYPPCVINILKGMKDDGRKRALFVLLNFFKKINLSDEEIKKKIDEWNKLNFTPLREGYVRAQLSWFEKHGNALPPNCDKTYYKEIGVCSPDFLCGKIKNPVNYVVKKVRLREMKERNEAGERKRGKNRR